MGREQAVDIHDLTEHICDRLGVKARYVYRLEIEVGGATIHMWKGEEGRCRGRRVVEDGEAITETISVPVIA